MSSQRGWVVILVEERLKNDDFVPRLNERHESAQHP